MEGLAEKAAIACAVVPKSVSEEGPGGAEGEEAVRQTTGSATGKASRRGAAEWEWSGRGRRRRQTRR